jgi:hypothetical protein
MRTIQFCLPGELARAWTQSQRFAHFVGSSSVLT